MKVAQFLRDYWMHGLMPFGFALGVYLDRKQDQKLTRFRNKSRMYSRELKPGEEVTWN